MPTATPFPYTIPFNLHKDGFPPPNFFFPVKQMQLQGVTCPLGGFAVRNSFWACLSLMLHSVSLREALEVLVTQSQSCSHQGLVQGHITNYRKHQSLTHGSQCSGSKISIPIPTCQSHSQDPGEARSKSSFPELSQRNLWFDKEFSEVAFFVQLLILDWGGEVGGGEREIFRSLVPVYPCVILSVPGAIISI